MATKVPTAFAIEEGFTLLEDADLTTKYLRKKTQ